VRRRKVVPTPVVDADGVPECLRAGVCIEVWAPDVAPGAWPGPDVVAHGAYRRAIDHWREMHGIGPWEHGRMPPRLRRPGSPWSFDYLAQEPERLAEHLRSHDLPPDWRPTPAPPEWCTPTATRRRS
jgi:hypothetical protein